MENDSTSQTSPSWPTNWPRNSFPILPTIGYVLLIVGVFFIALFAAAAISVAWLYANGHAAEVLAATRNQANASGPVFIAFEVAQIAAEAVLVILILLVMPSLTRLSLRALGFRAIGLRTIGWAIVGTIGMVAVADVGSSLIAYFYPHAVHAQLVEKIFENLRHNRGALIFFIVFAVVLQPIAEEMAFRVFIFNLFLRYGGFWIGAIVSGALFGAVHVVTGDADRVSGALLALGGMVLCWVYYRSRNAYTSMISHGLFNALSTAAIFFYPKIAGG